LQNISRKKETNKLNELYEHASRDGVKIYNYPFRTIKAVSIVDDNGGYAVGIDTSQCENESQEAEILAHELGHCETGSFYNPYSPFDLREKHERKADDWAINELVPKEKIETQILRGVTSIFELAEALSVSESFMKKIYRYYYCED